MKRHLLRNVFMAVVIVVCSFMITMVIFPQGVHELTHCAFQGCLKQAFTKEADGRYGVGRADSEEDGPSDGADHGEAGVLASTWMEHRPGDREHAENMTYVPALQRILREERHLPNYYIHGKPRGREMEYHGSHVVFLHVQKSGGSSIKSTMTRMGNALDMPFIVVGRKVTGNGLLTVEDLNNSTQERKKKRHLIAGSCVSGVCDAHDLLHPNPCSYFILGRDPVDRVVSEYFYCQQETQQDCVGAKENVSVADWALLRGSLTFRLLYSHYNNCRLPVQLPEGRPPYQGYSMEYGKVRQRQVIDLSYLRTQTRWEEYLEKQERQELLLYVLAHLETWFTVIGLMEEFDLSQQMIQDVYDIPLSQFYRGRRNAGSVRATIREDTLENMKSELRTNPLVLEALYEDLVIYERMREIMVKQKMMFYHNRAPK